MKEIKKTDPETAITAHAVRQICINGIIPHTKVGNRYLVCVDDVEQYFKGHN